MDNNKIEDVKEMVYYYLELHDAAVSECRDAYVNRPITFNCNNYLRDINDPTKKITELLTELDEHIGRDFGDEIMDIIKEREDSIYR